MIVRKAKLEDRQRIEKAYRDIFSHDDGGHSDFYFKEAFELHNCFILVDEHDELYSACQVHTKTLILASKPLRASMIVGLFTLEKHRHQGYMKELLTKVIDVLSHQELITLIQSYVPNIYQAYGFEAIYFRQHLTLNPKDIPVVSPSGTTTLVEAQDLLNLYKTFVSRFDGYHRRALADFEKLKHEVAAQNGKLIAYGSNQGLEAYACVFFEKDKVVIDELIYMNAQALMKVLNTVTSLNQVIELRISHKEQLLKLFPKAKSENIQYTYARLNSAKHFNELYHANVRSIQEAFSLAEKPLWFRENQ
jgi:predicted acetyltransferase